MTEKATVKINFRDCAACENLAAPNPNLCMDCVEKSLKGSLPMNLCVHESISRIGQSSLGRCISCGKVLVREFGRTNLS